ncbi:MAG TPA: hypothetical protein VIP08_14830, partial [Phenylobacterium sp.]
MDTGFKIGLAGAAALALLVGCATTPPKQTASSAARANPKLEAQASAFESFMRNARSIDGKFSGPADVAEGLRVGSAYEPKQFEAGMIAYAAVAAMQDPRFVAGVRKAAQDKRTGKGLAA